MSKKVRRIDFNPDEFLTGVFGKMNAAQAGIYWTICAYIYSDGGPVKEDAEFIDTLARGLKVRRPDVVKAIDFLCGMAKPKLMREVREDGTWLMQKRAEKELKAARSRIEGNTKPERTEPKDQQNQTGTAEEENFTEAGTALPTTTTTTNTNDSYASGVGNGASDTGQVGSISSTPLDRLCIEDFDAILVEVFGPEQARLCPNGLDLITARAWLEQGVERQTWQAVFRARQLQRKTSGMAPINALTYFNGARGQPGPGAMIEAHLLANRSTTAVATHHGGSARHDRGGRPGNGFVQILQDMTGDRHDQ